MKLYKVPIQIEFDICVWAKDIEQAKSIANDNVEEEMRNIDLLYFSTTYQPQIITNEKQIPSEWQGCCPYACHGTNKTVDQLVKEYEKDSTDNKD